MLIEPLKLPTIEIEGVDGEVLDYALNAQKAGWSVHVSRPKNNLPVELPAEQAEAWLRGHTWERVVMDTDRDLWWFDGKEFTNSVNLGCGKSLNQEYAPYRPLIPLTLGQLAEIEMLTKERDSAIGSQKAALVALEKEREESAELRVCNIRQAEAIDEIKIALENLTEWSRKESEKP
jgi:hypothetical protein